MKFKKYQEFFIKCLFINNDIIQNVECFKIFKDQFNIDLQLNNKEISDIKYKTIGYLNNYDILKLCKQIEIEEEYKLLINSTDINYSITINGKIKNRDETIIVISTEKMRKESINENVNNFFLDVTYKIIPNMHKSYKLLTKYKL